MDLDALLDDPKSLSRLRVLRAARRLAADKGLSISMEEIAVAAELSRRSVFRLFDSRDSLVAQALAQIVDDYDETLVAAIESSEPFDVWLTNLITRLYELHHTSGKAMWQLTASDDDDLPAELAALNRRRRDNRHAFTQVIADAAWHKGGGQGSCPTIVSDACAATISTFTTRSVVDDYGIGIDRAVACTVTLLTHLIHHEGAAR